MEIGSTRKNTQEGAWCGRKVCDIREQKNMTN